MEVLVGPTFTIDVPSSPPPPTTTTQADQRLFLTEDGGVGPGFRISGQPKFFAGDLSSESSSSIGTPDDSDNEEEEVQSGLKPGQLGLGSLDSLEDSLPIKRGLSSHFDGKSKSFTDLSQVSTLKELQKDESPFNKRRRVLIASKWSRRSSFYTWSNPKSMPLLPVVDEDHDYDHDDRDHDDDDEEEGKARKVPSASSSSSSSSAEEKKQEEEQQVQLMGHNRISESYAAQMRLRLRSFKTRSFSLADLQEHDDEDEDDD